MMSYNPYLRGKRQLGSEANIELENLNVEIMNKLNNATCVPQEMGILDQNKQINSLGLKMEFSEVKLKQQYYGLYLKTMF